jgi:hypothetical protein
VATEALAAEIVTGKIQDNKPEEIACYAAFCASAIRNDPDPTRCYVWLCLALSLPAGRGMSLLEEAQKNAPTAELRANLAHILEQVGSGETRSDRLKALLEIPERGQGVKIMVARTARASLP